MIDPTNPRVIQDSMRAMAGYSQGLIPTLMRTIARIVGAAANPRQQTPVFDRILSQIQPQVIRGLSQQSAVAAQNFVPQTRVVYDRDVIDPVTGARSTRTFDESDIQDLLATAQISQQDLDRDYRRREETVDVAPERLNVSQVDHVIRTMLRGAEAMGISAERLAAIDWAGIDLDTILTGAVENGEFNLDLSRIPGLDRDIADAFRNIADGIAVAGIQPVIQNAPLNRSQRTQASEEPERRTDDVPLNATLQRLSTWLERFIEPIDTPDQSNPPQGDIRQQRDPRTTLLQGLSGFLGQGAGPNPDQNRQSIIVNALKSMATGAGQVAVRAGNFAFNRLPQFIQRPILGAATQAGTNAAATAGMNAAGQAAAGAAAANAARVAVGLKLLSVGIGLAVSAIVGVVAGLKALANAAWATTQRVTQYNGALSAATAASEARAVMRDVRIGNIIGEGGAERIEANDNLADALAPLEASIGLIGNIVATEVVKLLTSGVHIANEMALIIIPFIQDVTSWLANMNLMNDKKQRELERRGDDIIKLLKGNKGGGMHPLGGDTVLTEMFNMALKKDMPTDPLIPPGGP